MSLIYCSTSEKNLSCEENGYYYLVIILLYLVNSLYDLPNPYFVTFIGIFCFKTPRHRQVMKVIQR